MTPRFLGLFVFVTGASVMALEMSASRLLAPYFGTSQIVWANLIGLILIGLAIGYLLGGRLADRRPDARIMYGIVLVAGLYQALVPIFSRPILAAMTGGWFGTPVTVILVSFAAILLVLLPPVLALATVSPFAIRLATRDVAASGSVAGGLYAASTAGSIVGTFAPAFFTIPFLGTRATIVLFAALQIAAAGWGLARTAGGDRRRAGGWGHFLWLLVPAGALALASGAIKPQTGLLFEDDSLYQYVQVVRQGGANLLVINEGGGIQSIYDPRRDFTGLYTDDYAVLPFLAAPSAQRPVRVLVIGSAGGTLFRLWDRRVRPLLPLDLHGAEIDPVVASLGPRYFGLRGDEARVAIGDGRVVLDAYPGTLDLVVVDAYSHQLYIPFQLSTVEFFRAVRRHLEPGGLVALNVNAQGPDDPLLLSFERTLRDVFPFTYVAKVRGELNYLVAGAARPVSLAPLEGLAVSADRTGEMAVVARELVRAWRPVDGRAAARGMILTDDRAPVEYLTNAMVLRAVKQALH